MYVEKYNNVVNITNDIETNAKNFLDSILYKNNINSLLDIVSYIETKYDSIATIYPSFIGNNAKLNGYTSDDNNEYIGKSISFEFNEYDTTELFNDLLNDDKIKKIFKLTMIDETIKLSLK